MNTVEIGKVKRVLPSSWNELTYDQLLEVCALFNLNLQAPMFKVQMLHYFLQVKNKIWKSLDPESAHFLCESLNFILENVTLTKATIRTIKLPGFPWSRLYGPSDGMADSTFAEFTKAQVRYEQYHATHDPAMLDEMVAILFRKRKPFWFILKHFVETADPRMKLIDKTLAQRTRAISKINPVIKKAVLLYFSGIQSSLPSQFPNVYKSKPKSKPEKSGGWSSLIISLADGKTDDQSLDRILNSNMYNVFLGLEQKSIEYFEFLRNYPQHD